MKIYRKFVKDYIFFEFILGVQFYVTLSSKGLKMKDEQEIYSLHC